MSAQFAYGLPSLPGRGVESDTRPVRIVTTRAQRRARPRIVYAFVATGVIFAIFIAQLLLSIALSSGAYSIVRLQNSQRDLGRASSALTEKLNTLSSAQNVAANAQNLGMLGASSPAYLRLSDGSVAGIPSPAGALAAGATLLANGASDSVPNSLLSSIPAIASAEHVWSNTANSPSSGTQSTGGSSEATTTSTPTNTVAPTPTVPTVPGALPSPVTH